MYDGSVKKHEGSAQDFAAFEATPDLVTIHTIENVLRDWLTEKKVVIVCGRWDRGAVSEIVGNGKAWLTGSTYSGKFAGLRDLRIRGEKHHLHLDLGKFSHAEYAIRPSVCYGWKPSFEILLVGDHGAGNIAVSAGRPYRKHELNRDLVKTYLQKFTEHRQRFGEAIQWSAKSLKCGPDSAAVNDCWLEIGSCALEMIPEDEQPDFYLNNKHPWESVQKVMDRLAR